MARVYCVCDAGTQYESVQQWRDKHYEPNKPEWRKDRLEYSKAHQCLDVPHTPYVSPHGNTGKESTQPATELERLNARANQLDAEIHILEQERWEIEKRIRAIQADASIGNKIRTVTIVEEIDNRPNKQGTRAGEMVMSGLRSANPNKVYEMIYLETSMNGKVKIIEKIRM